MFKKKEKYETKITTISGYSGENYEDNLKKFKKQLLEKAKENNTTLSLLVRKRIFDYDNWFKGINTIKEIEKLEKGE